MKNFTGFCAIVCILFSLQACHDGKRAKNFNQKTTIDDQGLAFIMNAHEADLTEIQTANVALKNSQNPRVINFAKTMIKDHTAADSQLVSIAYDNRVTMSNSPNKEHKTMISNLSKLNGPQFDKAYMQMMVIDHTKVIDMFRLAGEDMSNTLHKYSHEITPKILMHLDSARAISATLK